MPPDTDTPLPVTPTETAEPSTVVPASTSAYITTPSLSLPTPGVADTATASPTADTPPPPREDAAPPSLTIPPTHSDESRPHRSLPPHVHTHAHPHTRRDTHTSRPVSPETQDRIDQNAAQKEERLAQILAYVRDHGSITSFDIRQLFGVSLQTANSYTRDLVADGSLTKTVTVSYSLPR